MYEYREAFEEEEEEWSWNNFTMLTDMEDRKSVV